MTLWRLYLEPRLGRLRLRDVRVADGQAALNSLHRDRPDLSAGAFSLCKSTLSAVFALALRLGHVTANPVIGTSIRGMGHHNHRENGAYSLDEVRQMLTLFSGQVAAAIGIAAFLGLRGPEMEALEPSDFDGESMRIHRQTKTKTDVTIPVIAPLKRLLPGWTERIKLEREEHVIKKGLDGTSLRWKGWYGFRRGLATNLYGLGVPPEVACLILRNSREVCSNHYIRLDAGKKKTEAMDRLEAAFEQAELVQRASAGRTQ